MKFGPVRVANSIGGIVVHSVRQDGLVLKKGQVIRAEQVAALEAAGVAEIVVAQLDAGDVGENEAALQLAQRFAGEHVRVEAPFTGRSNLYSETAGVLVIDEANLEAANGVDERVTFATLAPWQSIVEGEMIGTVKIIPYAVEASIVARVETLAQQPLIRVAAYTPQRIAVISTLLPGLKASTVKKTLRVLDDRLAPAGSRIAVETRVPHEQGALSSAISDAARQSDIVIVFGASAITDRRDVIPRALEEAGGEIVHFGMPVDPGNLLLVGRYVDRGRRVPVIGAPGCARSPKLNGFDWVLQRLLAGIEVTSADIRRMGAGGLLMEIVSRGQPREKADDDEIADASAA